MTYEATLVLYFSCFLTSQVLIKSGRKKCAAGHELNSLVIAGLMVPVLLAALRYWVGTDWGTYYNQFYRSQNESWTEIFRDGYLGFMIYFIRKVISFTGCYQIYFGILSALVVFSTYIAFTKHTNKDIGLLLYLFYTMFFLFSFNIGKQYIAVAIVLCAYNYIFTGDAKKYFLLIFIAMAFHPSAIIAFPVYFLWDKEKHCVSKSLRTWLIVGGVIFLSLFYQTIMSTFTEVTEMSRYSVYTTTDASGSNGTLYLKIAMVLVELFVFKYIARFDERNKLFVILEILDILIAMTGFSSTQFKRSGIYFSITNIYVLASLPYIVKDEQRKVVKIMLYLFGFMYCFVIFYMLEQGHAMPYRIAVTSFEDVMKQIHQYKLFGN